MSRAPQVKTLKKYRRIALNAILNMDLKHIPTKIAQGWKIRLKTIEQIS